MRLRVPFVCVSETVEVARGGAMFERGLARPKAKESLGCMARAIDIVPALAGAQVIRTWSGMDGQMPDRIPDMGFSSVR